MNGLKLARGLRRSLEAARKDRKEQTFYEDIGDAIDKGEIDPSQISIRALFEELVPNGVELVRNMDPRHEGDGENISALMEADVVNTAAFSNITGQIVYNRLMQAYQDEAFVFKSLIPVQSTPFNGEKIAGIGRLGDKSEEVAEGHEYPTVGVGEDWIETPQTIKRGFIVPVTKEAIFFDRTGLILTRAGEVGHWMGVGDEKRAIDCVIDENRTQHRYKWKGTTYATYQTSSPWDNVTASNALVDWTDLDAAEQTLAAITDPNTGEPIVVVPKHLVVTRGLLRTAERNLNATELRFGDGASSTTQQIYSNPYKNSYRIVTSVLLASRLATDTDWFLGDISRAFCYMENFPLTVVQAPSNSELEFTRDIVMRFKASRRGEFATMEPRVMSKSTVA